MFLLSLSIVEDRQNETKTMKSVHQEWIKTTVQDGGMT